MVAILFSMVKIVPPGHVGILILFGKIDGSVTEGPSDSKVVTIGGKDGLPLIFNVGEEVKSLKKD